MGCKKQILELKARIAKFNQINNKSKEEVSKLMMQNLGLEENYKTVEGENTKLKNQLQMKK